MRSLLLRHEAPRLPLGHNRLTPRQRELALLLVGTGLSYKEIAASLDVSYTTICKHVERIYRVFGVRSRPELSLYFSLGPLQAKNSRVGKIGTFLSDFIEHYHSIPHLHGRGLNSTEAMTIVHLLQYMFKNGTDGAPPITVGAIARKMGLTARAVRATLSRLEDSGLVTRVPTPSGGANGYRFDGLAKALEDVVEDTKVA